ncbi:NAD(P)H-dependent flavin oxidoreductase [Kineosporia babensis]|uniref:Propionate 3-nitronate monooxygenase n=1 Tax=Kineosporia babensis TaxID=499548 RepID=A0A9X1SS29_9ACTN|nr:nitronate monooxygenase [Kineosporia babensis]MCD5310227.1 nitronate monooxygenase [Kineosporia babensis]
MTLGTPLPLVAAPMAGGPTTTGLAAAVAQAGAFPFLAAGYKSPSALSAEIEEVRSLGKPFGVNLFVPGPQTVDTAAFKAYAERIQPEADQYGLHLDPSPVVDDDDWAAKVALLVQHPVPVVSLTFGLPAAEDITALQQAGSQVFASVTTVAEAVAADALGVDGLVVQGSDAGGHSATHDPARVVETASTTDVVRQVCANVGLPVIAAGGVDGPGSVRRLLDAGASAVAVGTLLLRTDEAGTSPLHRAALADPAFAETVTTRAFTGRPARALRNGFTDRHSQAAPVAYPAVHHLTRSLRQAAARAGDSDRLHLWAGTGFRSAPTGSAAQVIRHLAEKA